MSDRSPETPDSPYIPRRLRSAMSAEVTPAVKHMTSLLFKQEPEAESLQASPIAKRTTASTLLSPIAWLLRTMVKTLSLVAWFVVWFVGRTFAFICASVKTLCLAMFRVSTSLLKTSTDIVMKAVKSFVSALNHLKNRRPRKVLEELLEDLEELVKKLEGRVKDLEELVKELKELVKELKGKLSKTTKTLAKLEAENAKLRGGQFKVNQRIHVFWLNHNDASIDKAQVWNGWIEEVLANDLYRIHFINKNGKTVSKTERWHESQIRRGWFKK